VIDLARSVLSRARDAAFFAYRARARSAGYAPELVWILSHMRSGSTLLTHLAASHRDVISAGERNAIYATPADLDRAVAEVHVEAFALRMRARYVLDQINHDRFVADERLFLHPRVRALVLVREPQGALSSMLALFGRTRGWGIEECLAAYLSRLGTLERWAGSMDERARWIEYDDLARDSRRAAIDLSRWLALEPPLSGERYRLRPFTGRRGDKSDRIRSGRVLTPAVHATAIDAAHLRFAREAFDRAREALDRSILRIGRRGSDP
jgi:hypothetical protein